MMCTSPLTRTSALTVRSRARHQLETRRLHLRAEATHQHPHATPADAPRPAPATPVEMAGPALVLTDREKEVVSLLVSAMSYAQIARELFIAPTTVGYHLSNVYAKAGISSRHELAAYVRSNPALLDSAVLTTS